MKKPIILGLFMMFIIFSHVFTLHAEETNEQQESLNLAPDVKSAILMERDTGEIIYSKNEHDRLPPASMTKLMTLLLVMEAIEHGDLSLDEIVRVSERAASMGGSQVFLEAGEEMSVEDLLKSVAVASGNDASVALAERIAGSEEAFVEKMNQKAQDLGLENTHFVNSSGLPANELYSTAYDMAIIARELLKYETITNYTSIYDDYLRKGQKNEFWLVNTNKLVKFYPGVDGLKTGYTTEAKYCLTATAKKDDMRVIAVVMGAESVKKRNATVSGMLDYAFNHYDTNKLYDKHEKLTSLSLVKAENEKVDIVTSEPISTLQKKGESIENISTEIQLQEEYELPILKGHSVGMLIVKENNEVVLESPLIVNEDVHKAFYLTLLKRTIKNLAKNN